MYMQCLQVKIVDSCEFVEFSRPRLVFRLNFYIMDATTLYWKAQRGMVIYFDLLDICSASARGKKGAIKRICITTCYAQGRGKRKFGLKIYAVQVKMFRYEVGLFPFESKVETI